MNIHEKKKSFNLILNDESNKFKIRKETKIIVLK